MANEIKFIGNPDETFTFSVYYDNNGTMTARETDTAMTEEPASSGVYKGSPATILNGDIVKIEDSDGNVVASSEYRHSVEKAAKMLINKAVQTKSTGAVVYYDDDGVTPLLTHTPTDSDTEITRTPS